MSALTPARLGKEITAFLAFKRALCWRAWKVDQRCALQTDQEVQLQWPQDSSRCVKISWSALDAHNR